ncbi:MAG: tetratricopeptide repeat protein [Hydrococcus sp. Prado102]|jgi:tetratricopeptide (TPR) repeat protein|nr:tetratricopeptide repeat protein [Hydrococcus sp. Prado102]
MAKIALLIGVSEFNSDDLAPLPKISADLEAMKEVLIDPELGGFAESDITVLKNPNKQMMEDAVYDLFSKNKRKKDDLLLFYFSGHGITDEKGIFYFSNSETRKENGRLRPTTAISSHSIHGWMNECPSKAMATILDCCYSGAFAKGMSAKGTANALIKEQLGGEGRAILTAASATEYAWAKDEFDLSAYTYYLLEGVRTGKASLDNDDWVSMEELHEYARRRISDAKLEMTPEFYPVKEGAKIRLFKAKITDPKEKYRKELQYYLKRGRIPNYVRDRLENLRDKLKISQDEAQLIERDVFAPLQQKQENLKRYEKALREALAEEGSLDRNTIEELKRYQQQLELSDEDVEAIAQQIGTAASQSEAPTLLRIKRPKVPAISVPFLKKPKLLIGSAVALTLIFLVNILQSEQNVEPTLTPSPTVSSNPQMSAQDFFERGLDKANKEDFKGAIEYYNQAIQLAPKYAEAYNNRGNAYRNLKNYPKAISDFNESIRLKNPSLHLPYNNRGLAYSDLKEYQKALADYTKAISLNPDYTLAYYNRGLVYSDLKEYQEAIADYTKAISLNREYAKAYNNRGIAYSDLKEYQKALADYNESIRLNNPSLHLPYNNRGNVYDDLKEYQKAIADYTKAISLNPDYALAYVNRGNVYKKLNEYQKALADYQKAAELYQKQGNTQKYQDVKEKLEKLQ